MAELAIFVFSIFFLSLGINQYPLRNWDEAWYAQVIKEMLSGKHGYLMPFWNGQYFYDKPPLYFWLNLPIVKLFGLGEWQFRILSVILTALSAVLIYKISKEIVTARSAFLASSVFLILGQVKERLAAGNIDGLLVFLILLTIYLCQKAIHSRKYLVLFMISWGLIALAKSWLYFIIFPIFTYPFISPKFYLKNLKFLPIALVTAFSWYILAATQFGKPFIDWYLLYKGAFGLPKIELSLIFTFVRDNFGILPILIFVVIKYKDILLRKTLLLCLGYLLLLSSYQDSFGWYLLPLYPLVAIVFAKAIDRIDQKKLLIVSILFISQLLVFSFIKNLPDNSLESAVLGTFIKDNFKDSAKVYFQGNDFPGVLYYSGKDQVNMVKSGRDLAPGNLLQSIYLVSRRDLVELPLVPKKMSPAPLNFQIFEF